MNKKLIVFLSLLSLSTSLFPAAAAAVAAVYAPAPPLALPISSSSCVLSPRDLERANQPSLCPEDFAQARKVWAFLNIAVRDKELLPIIAGYLPEPYTPNITISTISAKTTRNWGCDTRLGGSAGGPTIEPLTSMCEEGNWVSLQHGRSIQSRDALKGIFEIDIQDYRPTERGPNYRDYDHVTRSLSLPLGSDYMRLTVAVCLGRHNYCTQGTIHPRGFMFLVLNKKTGKLFERPQHLGRYKPAIEVIGDPSPPSEDRLPTQLKGIPLNADLCADVAISPCQRRTLGDIPTQVQVMLYSRHGRHENPRTCAALKATVPSTAGLVAVNAGSRCVVS
jgi:hypothetical protein